MAASHPDLFQFQLALNDWVSFWLLFLAQFNPISFLLQIKRQCRIRGSALLLSSPEQNITFCQVCAGFLLDQPIQCVR
jgi:hypothetical protein